MNGARRIRIGPRIGIKFGLVDTDPLAGVSRDATSSKLTPASSTEWSATLAAAGISSGGPSLLWLCQEASGNLADSIGSFTGTVSGAPLTYQQAISGWSRFGITGGDAGTAVAENTAAGLPDPASASMLMLSYFIVSATPGGTRVAHVTGNANQTIQRFNTTPRMQGVSGGNVATGTVNPTGAVRPYILQYDFTNNLVAVSSDQEILNPTRAAMTGKRHRFSWNFPGSLLYLATFFNAAAELTTAQKRTLLQTMGWSIAW